MLEEAFIWDFSDPVPILKAQWKPQREALISPPRLSEFDAMPHRRLSLAGESIRAARAPQIYAH